MNLEVGNLWVNHMLGKSCIHLNLIPEKGLTQKQQAAIVSHHNSNFRRQLTGQNIDENHLKEMLSKQKPAPALFKSTGARSLKK